MGGGLIVGVLNPSPFVLAGLVAGAAYGLTAVGFVLAYRMTGILNFAQGAIATVSAFSLWQLSERWQVPLLPAALIAGVFLPAVLALAAERIVFRRLEGATTFSKTAAGIALLLGFYGFTLYAWGGQQIQVPSVFPETTTWDLPGVVVSASQVGIVVSVAILCGGLFAFVRYSSVGVKLRATLERPDLAALRGINTRGLTQLAWIVSFVFAGLSGVLLGPLMGSDPLRMTLLVIYTLVAAVVAGMASLPASLGAGIGLAMIDALAVGYVGGGPTVARLRAVLPFAVLFLTLVVTAGRRAQKADLGVHRVALLRDLGRLRGGGSRPEIRPSSVCLILVAAGLVAVLAGDYWTYVAASGVAFAILFLSYKLFTAATGLVSLAQGAFAGLGAFTAIALSSSRQGANLGEGGSLTGGIVGGNFGRDHLPWLVGLLGAVLVAAVAGLIVALPTVRLRGIYLVLATLAYAAMIENAVLGDEQFTGAHEGKPFPRPAGFHGDIAYLFLMVGFFLVLAWLTARLERSRIGRELHASLSSPAGAVSIGIRPEVGRLIAFVAAAGIAAIGGVFVAGLSAHATPDRFGTINPLLWLMGAAIGGIGSSWGALFGGMAVAFAPEVANQFPSLSQGVVLAFGIGGLLILRGSGGVVGTLRSGGRRFQAQAQALLTPRSVRTPVWTGPPLTLGPRQVMAHNGGNGVALRWTDGAASGGRTLDVRQVRPATPTRTTVGRSNGLGETGQSASGPGGGRTA